jgi:two-component system, chemotaxis family, chemotaxis protein CheY
MKILVVDDEKDIQTLFVQQFRKEIRSGEIEFAFCYSGEEALKYLNETTNPEAILILSDINMPGMNGLVLLEKVKQKFKTPPPVVMMITAYGDSENLAIAKECGADDFLNKPIDFPGLKAKLNKIKS